LINRGVDVIDKLVHPLSPTSQYLGRGWHINPLTYNPRLARNVAEYAEHLEHFVAVSFGDKVSVKKDVIDDKPWSVFYLALM